MCVHCRLSDCPWSAVFLLSAVELHQLRVAPPTPLTVLNVNYEEVEIQESLDRGAFGEVYVGRWRGNEVAVKVRICPIERGQLLWYSARDNSQRKHTLNVPYTVLHPICDCMYMCFVVHLPP